MTELTPSAVLIASATDAVVPAMTLLTPDAVMAA